MGRGKDWLIEEKKYTPERELYWETIFALSNGTFAARGTLEESHFCPEVRSYFGNYIAGVFDKYKADYQAIVNLADFFNTGVMFNGELLKMSSGKIENYSRTLDMYNGTLRRVFLWTSPRGEKTEIEITRFISMADPHLAAQHYRIKPLNWAGEIQFRNVLDGNVTNIDFHVSGYQLRDEKYFLIDDEHQAGELREGGYLILRTKTTKIEVCEAFRCMVLENGKKIIPQTHFSTGNRRCESQLKFDARGGQEYSFVKVISLRSTKDKAQNLLDPCEKTLETGLSKGYEKILQEHREKWNQIWDVANLEIDGDQRDQRNVRFNIYHLIQMGNKNDPKVNIGSRGLTSEMHYGNSFWDTEIFMLPFYIYTDPDTARSLVKYRYLTLPEAKNKAKRLWFEGAMFPWMSSFPGKEQADYWEYANIAVHIVSDVIYGLMHYHHATKDDKFMLECGLELLIETARFWRSRVDYSPLRKKYVINTVKGPNEYDGVVNNNTYTNWNARWSLLQAVKNVEWARKNFPAALKKLSKKNKFNPREIRDWKKIAAGIFINYDRSKDLYIEDDLFLEKRPVDIKKMKPGKVITTELGLTWDTLLRHKIVKQADILLLMYLHRPNFSKRQLQKAWDFYEPITLHDSSLSYNTHCIVANELGDEKKADAYFQQCARLDLEDVMANVFLGIHPANAGGTWQCMVNGFCGMRIDGEKGKIEFNPHLPKRWKKVRFSLFFRRNLFDIEISGKEVHIQLRRTETGASPVKIDKGRIIAL